LLIIKPEAMGKVVVTGAGGFIGSHLTAALLHHGFSVKAVARTLPSPRLSNISCQPVGKKGKLDIVAGDIKSPAFCEALLQDCEYVFHLASLISVTHSIENPNEFLHTNVLGTVNLLNAAKQINGFKRFVYASTSEVYGPARYLPIDELHPLQPRSPYAASKSSAESFIKSFYFSFGLPVTIVRPFNTYGPGQSALAIIPKIISNLLHENDLRLGNLEARRDFLYVKDAVNAFVNCLHNGCVGETVNIGTGTSVSIKELLCLIGELAAREPGYAIDEKFLRPGNLDASVIVCDYGKMNRLTGWRPIYDLRAGLTETIEWFRQGGQ
jgi:nucleoside-diphosphate-sugar epimerase